MFALGMSILNSPNSLLSKTVSAYIFVTVNLFSVLLIVTDYAIGSIH